MKTASRILGSALFREGFEVQDAPLHGAERRGAPIFATVRASHTPIRERGPIRVPDLVVVADDTLVGVGTAGVRVGLGPESVLLIASPDDPATWRERLGIESTILTLPPDDVPPGELRPLAGTCAAAAARLLGVVSQGALLQAIHDELAPLGEKATLQDQERARVVWERLASHSGAVHEGGAYEHALGSKAGVAWVDLPFDRAVIAAPDVHGSATSVEVRTGLWRTMRPVIEPEHCHRCSWICSTFCPDGAISAERDAVPSIDYDHCKGCLVCVAVCPAHAIAAIPEREVA